MEGVCSEVFAGRFLLGDLRPHWWRYDPIGGGRAERSLSPDAGRGADAEREGILDLGRWVGGERCLILDG